MKKILFILVCISTFSSIAQASAAEKGWRYWGYYQAAPHTTSWLMANTGPSVALKDGAVEGWIFTLSSKNVSSQPPKPKPLFPSICKGVTKDKDLMRIALVIDFGSQVISPRGEKIQATISECVEIFPGANGLDVLEQSTQVRQSAQGFICAINRYPAKECSAEISVPKILLKK